MGVSAAPSQAIPITTTIPSTSSILTATITTSSATPST